MAVSSSLLADHRFTPQKYYFSASATNCYYRQSKPQSLVRPEGLGKWICHSSHRAANPRFSGL
jgi:hypothetical protein